MVQVISIIVTNNGPGPHFVVMEYLEHGDLTSFLASHLPEVINFLSLLTLFEVMIIVISISIIFTQGHPLPPPGHKDPLLPHPGLHGCSGV